jgi:hypothetical protein
MASITLRATNGGPLTNAQVDANFTNLNTEKIERDGTIPMTGKLTLDTPVATNASVNFPSSATNPTSPVAGDVWNNSNTLKFYNGTVALQLASLSGSETFTNKTINLSSNTLVATSAQLAAAITDETGTGSVVFANSPTLTTPTIAQVNASADFTVDATGDIILDAEDGDVFLKDAGVTFGVLNNSTTSAGNLVIKSSTNNALAFSTDGTTPKALLYGGVQGSYFTTSAALTSGPAFLATVSAGSTSIFGSLGTEPSGSNMDFKGGWAHNVGFDAATGNFIGISDGANNGGAMMLASTGGNGIEFYTIASTGSSNQTISGNTMYSTHRKMVIDQNGRLTVYGAAHISGTGLAVGTSLTPSGTDGRIDASNDVVAFSTSDARLKKDIENITDALEKVLTLRGVTFTWDEEHKDVHGYTGKDTGVIAQDVEKVLPEVVQHRDNGYMAVKYEKMMGLLIEAIKELNNKVDKCNCNCNK